MRDGEHPLLEDLWLEAQGVRGGVRANVNVSGLLGSTAGHIHQQFADDVTGWRAQSAVFLVHAEGLRQAPGGS
jgi:hypothetical protein